MTAMPRAVQLALLCVCLGSSQVAAQLVCKPALSIKQASFSEMINLRRVWTASLEIDATRCTTTSGLFSIGFVRRAEHAPELSFTEPFIWRQEQRRVVFVFWADEAVASYWIDDIATCPCRAE